MKSWKRLISMLLTAAMLFALAVPSISAADSAGDSKPTVSWEKVADAPRITAAGREAETEQAPAYADSDIVRVSIVLEESSTIEAGFSTENIALNAAAMRYREGLEEKQNLLVSRISSSLLKGKPLDVVWHLTLAANIISANVPYGQIEAIKAMNGVANVFVETRYEPHVVSKGTVDPNMTTASDMVGGNWAWASGYTGAGSKIAIVDTGLDLSHQSFDEGAFEYAISEVEAGGKTVDLITQADVAEAWDQLNIAEIVPSASAGDAYQSSKVPFAMNYVDQNTDATHENDLQGEHGSHVAGIAAANRYIPDGNGYAPALDTVLTQGEAPDAQLVVMKVFGKNGGAYDSDYFAAIEDAILLGCDAVNLSLGSSSPGFSVDTTYVDLLNELAESGIVWVNSAGNSYHWANSTFSGYLYAEDVSFATAGEPGTYANSLSVASVDNKGATGEYMVAYGEKIFFTESTEYGNAALSTLTRADAYEFVYIDGPGVAAVTDDPDEEANDNVGREGDQFLAIGEEVLSGKIAICNRGTSSFFAKANAAVAQGAIAVIIVNNTAGTIGMNLKGYQGNAPVVSILKTDGAFLRENSTAHTENDITYYTGTITVTGQIAVNDPGEVDYYQMSDFSSWGVAGDLSLKPEITAPGGNIYSVFGTSNDEKGNPQGGPDKYENMSGTSMAAPQIAGLTAVLAQYIRENDLTAETGLTQRQLIHSLLMSTAVPLVEEASGSYYSVLNQGAGLVDVNAAINAKAYILMDESATESASDGKIKVELGDDPDWMGTYSASFTVYNRTDEEVEYEFSADFFTQDIFWNYQYDPTGEPCDVALNLDTWTVPLDAQVSWAYSGEENQSDVDPNLTFDEYPGLTDSDIQAILDCVTGIRDSILNEDIADFDGDGLDTYDAYYWATQITPASATVPAGGALDVTVTFTLTDIDDYYLNGVYIEGYIFVKEPDTEDGELGVTHSIPVLGYYGSWAEPGMFDHGGYLEYVYDEMALQPYMSAAMGANALLWKSFGIQYAGEKSTSYFGGSPLIGIVEEDMYHPERNAMNGSDTLKDVCYTLIRNAAAGKLTLTDDSGSVLIDADLGAQYGAYYYVNGGSWENYKGKTIIDFRPDEAGVEEGTTLTAAITMATENSVDENGDVDWDSLGENAAISISFSIDNEAPVLGEPVLVYDEESGKCTSMTLSVSDNQFLAGLMIYDEETWELGDWYSPCAAYGPEDLDEYDSGASYEITFDMDEETPEHLIVVSCDYAANTTTYKLNLNADEAQSDTFTLSIVPDSIQLLKNTSAKLTVKAAPWGKPEEVTWKSDDEKIARVDDRGVVTGVAVGTTTVYATSTADENVVAQCEVEVYTINVTLIGGVQDASGQPQLFSWDLENDDTWQPGVLLESDLTAMAYNDPALFGDGSIYQQDWNGFMHQVDPETGENLELDPNPPAVGVLLEDFAMSYGINAIYGLNMAFGVVGPYLLFSYDDETESMDIMDNSFLYGWDLTDDFAEAGAGATQFVAIAWYGVDYAAETEELNEVTDEPEEDEEPEEDDELIDVFLALDDANCLWVLYPNVFAGGLAYEVYASDLDLDYPLMGGVTTGNSLVMDQDGVYAYLSHYDGNTIQLYQLGLYQFVTEDGEEDGVFISTYLGEMGDSVWPAALISATDNDAARVEPEEPTRGGQKRRSAAAPEINGKPVPAVFVQAKNRVQKTDLVRADAKAEDLTAELTASNIARGGLNAAVVQEPAKEPMAKAGYQPDPEAAEGEDAYVVYADEDTTNALITVEYEDSLTCTGWFVTGDYVSVNETEGKLVFALVSKEPIPAGEALVGVQFQLNEEETGGHFTMSTQELNDEKPCEDEPETFVVGEHAYSVTWEWSADLTKCTATLTCEAGDDEITVEANVSINHAPYGTLYTATVVGPYGETYVDYKRDYDDTPATAAAPSAPSSAPDQESETELPFKDVNKNDWFYSFVKDVYEQGLIAGKTTERYAPDEPISRAQIVAILWRLEGKPAAKGANPFKDIPAGIYYETAAIWANENGIVYGTDAAGTKFDPDTPITREQFAAIIYRYAEYKGLVNGKIGSLDAFMDANLVSAYAVDAFAWNNAMGIISGYSATTLNPQGTANRAQAAVIFSKLSALLG